MKKLSLFLFSFFLLLTAIYVWEKQLPHHYKIVNFKSGIDSTKSKPTKQVAQFNAHNKAINKSIAYAEIVKNQETGAEEIKVHLPPGKRLYNEEKMNEIASSANLEISTNDH